jgi:transcriptional regulator with XRE-family HTH domain
LDEIKKTGRQPKNQIRKEEWKSPGERVNWLIDKKFMGNRSTMARRLGFSPSTLSRVVTGEKPPGRRLLSAIVERLGVDSKWLLTGEGEPFVRASARAGLETAAPVANDLLPGPPQDCRELLTPESLDTFSLLGPSQYWYRLKRDDPIVKNSGRGFRSGDLLLLEADRTRFPKADEMTNVICVVTLVVDGVSTRKLGVVTHYRGSSDEGPARLEANTFDLEVDTELLVKEYIIRAYQNRKAELITRDMRLKEFRGGQVLTPLNRASNMSTDDFEINSDNIVAYWTGILYRPFYI